jgi:hypothetical protein
LPPSPLHPFTPFTQHVFQPVKREAADKMNDLLTEVTGKAGKNRFATGFATMVPLGKAN